MVAGHLHAEGSSMSEEKRVTFSLEERDQRDNVSLAPVRLVGGRTEREGRLQVRRRPAVTSVTSTAGSLGVGDVRLFGDIRLFGDVNMR